MINSDLLNRLKKSLEDERTVALVTFLEGPKMGTKVLSWPDGSVYGASLGNDLEQQLRNSLQEVFESLKPRRETLEAGGAEHDVFLEVYPPPPRLIMIGAVHIAIPLTRFARQLGFRTIVIDPRPVFATSERFSEADELIIGWPHEVLTESSFNDSTFLVVLSHDPKLDNPALKLALNSGCRYIGALGSRKTHARRAQSLKEESITDEQISRIFAPIGIDLGGRKPEEIALSILAEIIAVQNGTATKQPGIIGKRE